MNETLKKQWKERKPRTVNYSPEEVDMLISEMSGRQRIMFGGLKGTGLTLQHREKIWIAIAKKINALGVAKRSVRELKRKWIVLKHSIKKKDCSLEKHFLSETPYLEEDSLQNFSKADSASDSGSSQIKQESEREEKDSIKLQIWKEQKELILEELKLRRKEVELKEQELKLRHNELSLKEEELELRKMKFSQREMNLIQNTMKTQY